MQQALQIKTVINEAMVQMLPELTPLLGHHVQMIALDLEPALTHTPQNKISFEQFLKNRPAWPQDKPAITLQDMDDAIMQGAINRADL
jgi:hypothetical protein